LLRERRQQQQRQRLQILLTKAIQMRDRDNSSVNQKQKRRQQQWVIHLMFFMRAAAVTLRQLPPLALVLVEVGEMSLKMKSTILS
jgi:hypothetical protein